MTVDSTHKDLKKIATCHRSAFPKSFSSRLGHAYCMKMLEWYLSTEKAFLFHIMENDQCVGYCGGIINDGTLSSGSSSAMTQYSFNQAIKSLLIRPWLLFHKEMFKNYGFLLKNIKVKLGLKKQKRSVTSKEKFKKEPYVGLVVIGVDANYFGKGYGSKLLIAFEEKAKTLGINKIRLTVKPQNTQAIKAYKRNGWEISKESDLAINMVKYL